MNAHPLHQRTCAHLSESTNPVGKVTGLLVLLDVSFIIQRKDASTNCSATCAIICFCGRKQMSARISSFTPAISSTATSGTAFTSPAVSFTPLVASTANKRQEPTKDTEDAMGCCAHSEFSNKPTPLRAFLCTNVGPRQILHSKMLSVLGRAELGASSIRILLFIYTRCRSVEFSTELNLCEVRKHFGHEQDCGSGMRFRVCVHAASRHS